MRGVETEEIESDGFHGRVGVDVEGEGEGREVVESNGRGSGGYVADVGGGGAGVEGRSGDENGDGGE